MNDTTQKINKPQDIAAGPNYSAVHCGAYSDLHQYELDFPGRGVLKAGKVFLQELVKTTGMEVSINNLPVGQEVPFSHAHKENEELFIFTRGQGTMAIDGELVPVQEGSCVRLAPAAARCLKNTGSEALYFIVVQAKANSLGEHTFADGYRVEQELKW